MDTIRGLAPIVEAITDTGIICAMGNETAISNGKELFKELKNLS